MPATELLERSTRVMMRRQWWLEEIVEDAPAIWQGDSAIEAEVAYYSIRWWAYPYLFCREAAQQGPERWEWPEILLALLSQWPRFVRERPAICREVRIRR